MRRANPQLHQSPRKPRGFSLLEILVAFVLLALAMTALMQIFSTSLNGTGVADHYAKATMLAQSKLASTGVEEALREGTTNGTFDELYTWKVSVKAYEDPLSPPNPANQQFVFVKLYEVEASVSFPADDQRTRNVTLTKLLLGPRDPV